MSIARWGDVSPISPRLEPPPRFDKPGATLRHEIMGRLLFVCTSKAGPSRRFCDFNAELTWGLANSKSSYSTVLPRFATRLADTVLHCTGQ
jgi:hypothetical protein